MKNLLIRFSLYLAIALVPSCAVNSKQSEAQIKKYSADVARRADIKRATAFKVNSHSNH